jgi:hypothetical protein
VAPDHRSAHPDIAGVPWWGAVLIAATLTAIGFAFDAGAGNKELSIVFAGCYVVGCIFAALAVRQAGIFTAVIQPPLILFVSVPTAYYLFTGGQSVDLKDTLINCAYPLIERFPLMFFTSAVVLVIGMGRWYYGMSTRRGTPRTDAEVTTGGGLASRLSSLLSRHDADDAEDDEPPPRRRTADRPSRSTKTASATSTRGGKPSSRSAPSRSRHARPPETEIIQPVADRPRRTRTSRQAEPPPPAEPRRRPRTSSTPRRTPPPTDRRYERPERRRRLDDYEPLEPHGSNGNGTHHPVSRVRYRGAEDSEVERADYRPRRRTPRDRDAESWEYDV